MHHTSLVSTAASGTVVGSTRLRRSLAATPLMCNGRQLKHFSTYNPSSGIDHGSLGKHSLGSQVAQAVHVQQCVQPASTFSGLLCHPDVKTPVEYINDWSQRVRPRLDALWSSILRSSNAERVLLSLDDLLMHLRSSRSLAVHIQQQHHDATWRAAAAQTAAGCQKYETYIYTSQTLATKLTSIHKHLQQQAVAHNSVQQQKTSRSRYTMPLPQLLQLCRVLLACVTAQLPQDSLTWLAAQELPDPNAVQLQQLRQQERELIAAIDDVIARPVLLELPTSVDTFLDHKQQQQQQHMQQAAGSPPPSAAAAAAAAAGVATGTSDTTATANHSSSNPDQAADTNSCELVYITRSVLAQLLQCRSDSRVRRQLYTSVLQPKLSEAATLLDKLARCRQYQAQLTGYSCYSELVRQRLSHVCMLSANDQQQTLVDADIDGSSSSTELDHLLQLASMLQELAEQEVSWIMQNQQQEQKSQVQKQQSPQEASDQSMCQQVQQQEQHPQQEQEPPTCHNHHQQQRHSTGPWDWDYLLHQTHQSYLDAVRGSVLPQHMHVSGVLAGFSGLLQQLLGVELQLRAAGTSEVWGDQVIVLMVVRGQQPAAHSADRECVHPIGEYFSERSGQAQTAELLGTIYLDIGGSYGCRMLRYTRASMKHSADAGDEQELQQQAATAPAVAVGLSGSRPHVPGGSQQHQQQYVQHLWQRSQELDSDDEDILSQAAADISNDSHRASRSVDVQRVDTAAASHVLTLSQLWEFGHEMGHALHLILSSRQPACHLSGRFVSPDLLELPSHIMERLFTYPELLSQLCLHHQTLEPLPAELSAAVGSYYGCKYNSALALSARTAAALAEQMYCEFGGDGDDYWRQAWRGVAGLPGVVAQQGSLREMSLLPVMAAHQGTYYCYLRAWCVAAYVCEHSLKPVLVKQGESAQLEHPQNKALQLFAGLHAGTTTTQLQQLLMINSDLGHDNGPHTRRMFEEVLELQDCAKWVWQPLHRAKCHGRA